MRIHGTITMLMTMAVIHSCSIKEDRAECPCFLDVEMLRQTEETFPSNKAWCSVWTGGTENVGEHVFDPVVGTDGLYSCTVKKNPSTAIIVSNMEPKNGKITITAGQQMERLYVSRQNVECTGDFARIEFNSFSKQYVCVTFQLNKEAFPHKEDLTLSLDSPYDGLSLPSMAPHKGAFRYMTGFDENGKAVVNIPPQGGPGMKIGVQLGGNPPAKVDLYRLMLNAGFCWEVNSLSDFEATIGLNSVDGIIQFVDWDIVQLEDIKY